MTALLDAPFAHVRVILCDADGNLFPSEEPAFVASAEVTSRFGLAAVSSSADARIAASFEVTGMASFFPPERRFSAEDSLPGPTSKPDPAIYQHALATLGLRPEQAAAVEDSVAGATAAVAAGIPTFGNLQFVQQPEREARREALQQVGVTEVVTSWREVLDLLAAQPAR